MQHNNNDVQVVQVAPDLTGLLPVALVALLMIGIVGALALLGNIVAIVILSVVGTAALIRVGFGMANSGRRTELEGRALQMHAGSTGWQLEMENKLKLMGKVSDVQSKQALTGHRDANSTVAAIRAATAASNGSGKTVEELVLGNDFDANLT